MTVKANKRNRAKVKCAKNKTAGVHEKHPCGSKKKTS